MKIELSRKLLLDALGNVSAAIPSRTTKPVLQNALLTVANGKAELTCTDCEVSIQHEVRDFECKGSVSLLLPARRVIDTLKEMGDERVVFDVEDKSLRIIGSRSKCNIPTENPADFPATQESSEMAHYSVPGNLLKKAIRRTSFAVGQQENNAALGGVQFDLDGSKLTLVATDTRRLSLFTMAISEPSELKIPTNPIVPVKALSLVERAVPDTEDVVDIGYNEQQIIFKADGATIISRLVEGKFPKYRTVIPKSHNISVDVLNGALHGIVRQAMIYTAEESRGVDFEFSEGVLKLKSRSADTGESESELPISYTGNPLVIRLDGRKVSDFLKTFSGESQLNFKVSDDKSPAVLAADDGSTYVIMIIER